MKLLPESRREALRAAEHFLDRADYHMVVLDLASAVADAIGAAHTEWRLGQGDPSPYLRDAIADARQLMRHLDKLPCPTVEEARQQFATARSYKDVFGSFSYFDFIQDRVYALIAIWDAMYCQILLGEPVDEAFRRASAVPCEELGVPRLYADGWVYPWDAHVLHLVETGGTLGQWDEFTGWLKGRRHASNMLKTILAYRALIDAARTREPKAAAKAIAEADKCFRARRQMTVTWGGGDLSDQTVDQRLACAIKKAELIRPGITAGVDTPHRWRW